ncbi:flavin-containing monooxygenase [Pyruvatibacter mobilis]|uniref:flavin-containing monooxygenase n=1 Tax=Pyruvatibacter mobilis TaxID=1712261 RepID=UPI003BAE7C9D
MPDTATLDKTTATSGTAEHFDVLIVGAGISGVGAAYHLQDQMPGTSFVVLDAMEDFGGTWWMHRYPGIRSDSDLYTFGYRFKPWTGKPIATAEEIRTYMGEVIEENDLARHIRYKHRILSAEWSDETKLWTIHATRTDTNEDLVFTCGFLWMCQGYYRHSEGYTPEWPDMDKFKGDIIHPQTWPEDYDYKGKKVIVIGSGATTATIVPAMAPDCEHITVLQRSPTYFVPGRNENEVADFLRMLEIDESWIHEITRRSVLFMQGELTRRSAEEPDVVAKELIGNVKELLPEGYDVDKHFTPKYRPWRQRVAFVPEGDLFAGIKSGKASMVTDEIDRFTEKGILTKSGEELEADLIITATGFNLCSMGDIAFSVNGKPVDFHDTVTYRGMMFTGVPNMAWIFGYFRASWTLRVDMVGDFICRLLKHMQQKGAKKVSVALREEDKDMPILDWIDPEDFNPGYIMRNMHLLPKRGTKRDWQHTQDYWAEQKEFPLIDLDDEAFVYE